MFQLIKSKPYVAYRYGLGTYVRGVYTPDATPEEVDFSASIQPAKFYEIMQMPEGDRTSNWVKVYTKTLLRTKKEGDGGNQGDYFQYKSDWYEVIKQKDYDDIDTVFADHYCLWSIRLDKAPDEIVPGGAS